MSRRGPSSDPADLSALARRGLLSEPDIQELERELSTDEALRTLHQVGLDVDRSTAVRAGDEALIARAADGALARIATSGLAASKARPSSRRRRLFSVLLAAALVSATGIAAAMWAGLLPVHLPARVSRRIEPSRTPAALPHPIAPSRSAEAAPVTQEAVEPVPGPLVEAAGVTHDAGTFAPSASHVAARGAPEATASALFKTANAARREGDFSQARRLYTSLIARYPSSDEARLSRVSLGKLLLATGDPSNAEREFRGYLRDGQGQLAEEALVSQAQSLQKLGRADAERQVWQRLIADHPNSVYAAEARGRLEALRSAAPAR